MNARHLSLLATPEAPPLRSEDPWIGRPGPCTAEDQPRTTTLVAEPTARWAAHDVRAAPLPPASLAEARGLRAALSALLSQERFAAAEFLVALAEFDRRRGWAPLGHSGLFSFLVRELRFSKGAAFYRITAAGLVDRFPEVLAALRDGRLCPTSVAWVASVVDEDNLADRLPRFFGLSSREAKALAAELAPNPAPTLRTVLTKLPVLGPAAERSTPGGQAGPAAAERTGPTSAPLFGTVQSIELGPSEPALTGWPAAAAAADLAAGSGEVRVAPREPGLDPTQGPFQVTTPEGPAVALGPSGPVAPRPQDEFEPLTGELRRLHVTVSRQFLEKLGAARSGLSRAIPGASVERVLGAALDALLEKQARRRGLVERPRRSKGRVPSTPGAVVGGGSADAAEAGKVTKAAPPRVLAEAGAAAARVVATESQRPDGSVEPARLEGPVEAERGRAVAQVDRTARVPAPPGSEPRTSRYVSAAVRREVWRRDGARCQFPLEAGGQCGSTHRLELDHLIPVALGGRNTADNLRVICQFHNQAAAEEVLGPARMAHARARRPSAKATGRPDRGKG